MTPVKPMSPAHCRRCFVVASILLCAGIGVSFYVRHAFFREGSDQYRWLGGDLCLSGSQGSARDEAVLRYRDYMTGGSREEDLYNVVAEDVPGILEAAEKGDPVAQCRMGFACFEGIGVPKDEVQGAQWYWKSADQGFGRAERALAFCYSAGNGVKCDRELSLRLYERAACHGDLNAALAALSEYRQEAFLNRWFEENGKEREAKFKWNVLSSCLIGAGAGLFGFCLQDVGRRRRQRREMAEAELRAMTVKKFQDLKDAPKCRKSGS